MTDALPPAARAAHAPASTRVAWGALLAVVTLTFALAWRWGGGLGIAHLALYLVALTPGIPVGLKLFGPRHAGAWIVGGVLGYALTAVGVPLAPALVAVAVYRLFGFWVPTVPALGALAFLPRAGRALERAAAATTQ